MNGGYAVGYPADSLSARVFESGRIRPLFAGSSRRSLISSHYSDRPAEHVSVCGNLTCIRKRHRGGLQSGPHETGAIHCIWRNEHD